MSSAVSPSSAGGAASSSVSMSSAVSSPTCSMGGSSSCRAHLMSELSSFSPDADGPAAGGDMAGTSEATTLETHANEATAKVAIQLPNCSQLLTALPPGRLGLFPAGSALPD